MPKPLLLLLLCILQFRSISQILPAEGSRLHYRLIGFTFPADPKEHTCKIEIAPGTYYSVDSFGRNIISTIVVDGNRVVAEVPAFGSGYTWRTVYAGKRKKESALHHFTTLMNPRVDSGKVRLRLLQTATAHEDSYVAVDADGVLYDMAGRPVWYVPDTNGLGGGMADFQFTPQATITFILGRQAYEINYNGDILWKAPNNGRISGDTAYGEIYHHEFTRCANGRYMILGAQMRLCKTVSAVGGSYIAFSDEKITGNGAGTALPGYNLGRFGVIIAYDAQGNIVWTWKCLDHLPASVSDYYLPNGELKYDPHDNAFFFDEADSIIYLSYRNTNSIVKIRYPSGKVLHTYGTPGGGAETGLFCNQHGIRRTADGYLYCFNNNSCGNTDALPAIEMFQESASPGGALKKTWEYTCTAEDGAPKKFANGGNVMALADGCMFVNMGSEYSKLFIINRDKHILWSALPERYMVPDKKWVPVHEYKACIIGRKDLERVIWNAEMRSK